MMRFLRAQLEPLFKTPSDLMEKIRARPRIFQFSRQVRVVFDRLSKLKEDRAIVLVSALFVENAIDDYLASIISGFTKIRDQKDMTFSLKIDLAKSLTLSPSNIFNCAHKIREIRNMFAHNARVRAHKGKSKKEVIHDAISGIEP